MKRLTSLAALAGLAAVAFLAAPAARADEFNGGASLEECAASLSQTPPCGDAQDAVAPYASSHPIAALAMHTRSAKHDKARHHLRHHLRRRHEELSRHRTAALPLVPVRPDSPQRSERRAMLPQVTRAQRHGGDSRTGTRGFAAVMPSTIVSSTSMQGAGAFERPSPAGYRGFMASGRGPPCGPPSTTSPLAEPPRFLRNPVGGPRMFPGSPASFPSPGSCAALGAPCVTGNIDRGLALAASSYRFVSLPEAPTSVSHAAWPEGAAA
jgi:hypothetical protein